MSDFDRWNAFREAEEGGWSDDPADAGGETKYGISKAAYPHLDIAKLTRAEATEIAKRDYWRDDLEYPLNIAYADAAFNCGAGNAREWLEECDGWTPKAKADELNEKRMRHHMNRAQSKPSQVRFIEGWAVRVLRADRLSRGDK